MPIPSKPKPATTPALALWINGKSTPSTSQRSADIFNPASGEIIRRVPLANEADIDQAVAAAKTAFPAWRESPPLKRARILTRYRELMEAHQAELVRLISEEHGKTLLDAAGSLQRGIEVIEFASGVPHLLKGEHAEDVGRGVDCHSLLQPVGVCAGITPFNFYEQGYYLGPTLFDHVTPDMSIYKDEIFGPVLIVLRVANLDEAIALINRNPYANGTAIFTRSGAARGASNMTSRWVWWG